MIVSVSFKPWQDNPQLIFESLNSTGMALTQADIVRNYVWMGHPEPEQAQLYETHWRPMYRSGWLGNRRTEYLTVERVLPQKDMLAPEWQQMLGPDWKDPSPLAVLRQRQEQATSTACNSTGPHRAARYPVCQSAEEVPMSSAVPFPKRLPRRTSSIFIPEHDPEGRPIASWLREFAYAKQTELASYRQHEMPDDAEIASLIEQAIYRTSKAISERAIEDPTRYLFRIYRNSVDAAIRKTVKVFGMEPEVLAQVATSNASPEDELLTTLTRKKVMNAMDEKGRALWEKHLLGYDLDELAEEEGQTADYLGQRLRRATERALRRIQRGTFL